MMKEIEKLEFSDFLLGAKSEATKQRFNEPVVTITMSKGEGVNKSGIMKFNAIAAKNLNLVLSDEDIEVNRAIEDEIDGYRLSKSEMDKLASFAKKALVAKISKARENKKVKTVTLFTGKNAAGEKVISLINTTDVGNEVPVNIRQRVSASTYSVKLKQEELKKLYEQNDLPMGNDFKDAEDMVFYLIMSKTQIGETNVNSCYLVKPQAVVGVVKDPNEPKKERSDKQNALSDKMYDWFEAERLAGRTPSVRLYWKAHPGEKKALAN